MQDVIPSNNHYLQIVNLGNLHWVCISSLHSEEKTDNQYHAIYDSLAGKTLSDEIKSTIAALSHCKEDNIRLEVQPAQQ